jgi:opacity protein-like surface antigen
MRLRTLTALLVMAVFTLPAVAAAQHREPAAGSTAIGGDLGVFVPDEEYHTGFAPSVTGEFYLLPRVSLRVLGGWSRNRFVNSNERFLDQYRGSVNLVYNWEGELWHPFVTGGIGAHRIRVWQDEVETAGWYNRFGLNVGAGVEYFVRPKVTFKAEGVYHWVDQSDLPEEARGFAVSIGMKKYF